MARYPYLEPEFVSAAEVSRNFGQWQDRAIGGPVIVTHHGRARVAIISAEQFETWRRPGDNEDIKNRQVAVEASLFTVLDHIGEGFYSVDRNLRFISVNGFACTFFGHSANQLVGHSIVGIFPTLEESVLLDRIKRVQRTGEDLSFEGNSSIFPDRFIEVRIFPHPDGVGVVFKNVTDEIIRERSRIESKNIMQLLSISDNIGYIKLNIRSFPTHCSDSIYNITGLSCEQVCHVRFLELFPMAERKSLQDALEDVLTHGRSILRRSKMYSKGDQNVDVELSIAPTLGDAGIIGALVLTNFSMKNSTEITEDTYIPKK